MPTFIFKLNFLTLCTIFLAELFSPLTVEEHFALKIYLKNKISKMHDDFNMKIFEVAESESKLRSSKWPIQCDETKFVKIFEF